MRRYHEYAPPARWKDLVACVWTIEAGASTTHAWRVLPDGCTDLILDLRSDAPPGRASYHVGTMTTPLLVRASAGIDLIGVRLLPGGSLLSDVSASECLDNRVDVSGQWPGIEALRDELANLPRRVRPATLIARLEDRLRGLRVPRGLVRADRLLRASAGSLAVDDVGRATGLTPRQLQRLYLRHTGTTPKFAARVYRLERALKLLTRTSRPLAQVALEAGFFDQAHMHRDVRALAGVTPLAYRREYNVAFVQSPADELAVY
jgi:AraC-like DNA-binding protein